MFDHCYNGLYQKSQSCMSLQRLLGGTAQAKNLQEQLVLDISSLSPFLVCEIRQYFFWHLTQPLSGAAKNFVAESRHAIRRPLEGNVRAHVHFLLPSRSHPQMAAINRNVTSILWFRRS